MAGNPNAWLGTHIHGGSPHTGWPGHPWTSMDIHARPIGRPHARPIGRPRARPIGRPCEQIVGQLIMISIVNREIIWEFLLKGNIMGEINKSGFQSITLTFYHTQHDASDHIYPLGPPKPICYQKTCVCIVNGSEINEFKIFPLLFSYCPLGQDPFSL